MKTHFFVHSLAVAKNAALSVFNCCAVVQILISHSNRAPFSTYRRYLGLKGVICTWVIDLLLYNGEHLAKNSKRQSKFTVSGHPTCSKSNRWFPLAGYLKVHARPHSIQHKHT